jgi:hypothetical protein
MNITQNLEKYRESQILPSELEFSLLNPAHRRIAYQCIVKGNISPYRVLLRFLLQEEIEYRNALWNGYSKDEADYHENIYQCSFLLSRCGNPEDVILLWKVQYLNQDIGEIDVGNFVGAGIPETLSFLKSKTDETSREIAQFISDSIDNPRAIEWLKEWEKSCYQNLEFI